jgi:hypothetical protein
MQLFVSRDSIIREIWGKSDTVLFIFAGSAAEFALNKAVDWLYFTGRLPADPLGRLFSTVEYARQIIFAEAQAANKAIDKITGIHKGVEQNRGATIPDWAYRDVLFMLIDYSIRSYEMLERSLTVAEKEEVFDVFFRMGTRMGITGLPQSFNDWLVMREQHLKDHLAYSKYTADLYRQYQKHLGAFRYMILKQVHLRIVPPAARKLLPLGRISWIGPVLSIYKFSRLLKLDKLMKNALLPAAYKTQVNNLDTPPQY